MVAVLTLAGAGLAAVLLYVIMWVEERDARVMDSDPALRSFQERLRGHNGDRNE